MVKPQSEVLVEELDILIVLSVVAIVKQIAKETGEISGTMRCPCCAMGDLRWHVASSNGHARVRCNRKILKGNRIVQCIDARE